MRFNPVIVAIIISGFTSCGESAGTSSKTATKEQDSIPTLQEPAPQTKAEMKSAAAITETKQVPVLCYHSIRDQIKSDKVYTVTIPEFASHLKMLKDSGYNTILPQQYLDYLAYGTALPEKPVMLSFDDTRVEHYTIAGKQMEQYGFRGAFFIMNIAIGKPNYMSAEQIKLLSDSGHTIGSHTWDHQNAKNIHGDDWKIQLDEPKAKLESITGKPVEFFAYPFGVWTDSAAYQVKNRGIKAAFILTQKRSTAEPLYTIRRMIVPSGWNGAKLKRFMDQSF